MSLFRSSAERSRVGRLPTGKSATISVLDVGSTKISCIIAKLRPRSGVDILPNRSHSIEVLGFGHQRSRGIKSGVVVDMDEAENALRLAVDAAENSAKMPVESLIVSVSAGRLGSETYSSGITLGGREVEPSDVRSVLASGQKHALKDQRAILHALPIGYSIDNEHGIKDPLGMVGDELGVDMHVVNCDSAPLRNLENCINRSHLRVDGMVAAPYASGLAALVEDETQMGCACIDMGGGTTTVSIFLNQQLVYADAIAVGGNHVTMDIARILSMRVGDAERLKVLHGKANPAQVDESEMIAVPPIGDDGHLMPEQISVAQLAQFIRPRVEETFEMVRDRINRSGFAGAVGRRIVLTGGASQLVGASEVAARVLSANIRLGRPMGISGLPKTAKGPAFSTVSGLLIYPQLAGAEYADRTSRTANLIAHSNGGSLSRVGRWLKESF
ncbi:MAG: cell division protein FtsA [Rhizobiaceae bacterium]